MRIAFLTPEFVTEAKFDGGLANYLSRVSRGLLERGHEVELFVLADVNEDIDFDGIAVHRVKRRPSVAWNRVKRGMRRLRGPDLHYSCWVRDGLLSLADAFARRHSELGFDLVQGSDFGATAAGLPQSRDYAVVTRLSWYAPACRKEGGRTLTIDRWVAERMERRAIRNSDAVYGPTQVIAEAVGAWAGRTVDVLRPPVPVDGEIQEGDSTIYRERLADRPYILFFGRICRLKGVYQLARAVRPVLEMHPDMSLVLVGREDPVGILEELQKILAGAADRLIHITRLRHADLFPIVRRAAMVVLPSRVDNFPNACFEAMMNGQIVVGTREAGFGELIQDGKTGFLVSRDCDAELTDTIEKVLLLDPDARDQIARDARESLTRFASKHAIDNLIALYDRVLEGRKARVSGSAA